MRKGYIIIFDTTQSDTECMHELQYALGNLASRSSGSNKIIKKMTTEQIDEALKPAP